METVSTIVCPNCGANASNFHNCEYCGSLLVRFIDKNIPLDEEKYSKQALKLEGLEDALTKNLEEQAITNGRNHIHTHIRIDGENRVELDVTNPKAQTELVLYNISKDKIARVKPTKVPKTEEQSLVICVRFFEPYHLLRHRRFKELDIYNLFSLQVDTYGNQKDGTKLGTVYQYYLDFGRDVEGAAAIITQIYQNDCVLSLGIKPKITYEQTSLTDEEYMEMTKKAMKGSKFWSSYTTIFGILSIILSLIVLFISVGDDDFPLIAVIGGVALGAFLIWHSFHNLNH